MSVLSEGPAILGIYGAGGFAREVMPVALAQIKRLEQCQPNLDVQLCFVETEPSASEVNGYPVLSESDFINDDRPRKLFNIAIAGSRIRQDISERLISHGARPFSVMAGSAEMLDCVDIADGALICANAMITSNVIVGKSFHANIYAYVAHDCVIGDYVTFAPRVSCNGNIHIKDHAYIGTGAVIKQGTNDTPLVIGEGAIVGMGAVVTKNVPDGTTVIGNPAKPFVRP